MHWILHGAIHVDSSFIRIDQEMRIMYSICISSHNALAVLLLHAFHYILRLNVTVFHKIIQPINTPKVCMQWYSLMDNIFVETCNLHPNGHSYTSSCNSKFPGFLPLWIVIFCNFNAIAEFGKAELWILALFPWHAYVILVLHDTYLLDAVQLVGTHDWAVTSSLCQISLYVQ